MAANGLFGALGLSYETVWMALAVFAVVFIFAYLVMKHREAVMDAGIAVGFGDALWGELKEAAGFGKKGKKKQGG